MRPPVFAYPLAASPPWLWLAYYFSHDVGWPYGLFFSAILCGWCFVVGIECGQRAGQ